VKKWILWGSLAAVLALTSCNKENEKLNAITIVESQFETTVENWSGDFAQYSDAIFTGTKKDSLTRAYLQIGLDRARLPVALDSTKYGLRSQSNNRRDSLFTFFKKKVTGFIPGRDYNVVFNVDLGTSYFEKSVDSLGSPAAAVYLKAGASSKEPVKTLVNGYYRFNLDKGKLSQDGTEMVVLGNVSNGTDSQRYTKVSRSNGNNPVKVRPNANGEIWLCVGVESGYKGISILYLDKIKTTVTE